MQNEIWRSHMDSVARGIVRDRLDSRLDTPAELPPVEHSPSLMPSTVSMSSFGIAEDPDVEARKNRGIIFAASVAVFMVIAGIVISRSPAEPVAKPKEEKPAAAAVAPPPPSAAPLPAPVASASAAKEEPKPAASAAPDEDKPKKKPIKRHRRAKAKTE